MEETLLHRKEERTACTKGEALVPGGGPVSVRYISPAKQIDVNYMGKKSGKSRQGGKDLW